METLRFLMVSSFYPPHHLGGDAVHVESLSRALAERGHEVHVEYSPAAYHVKRPLGPRPEGRSQDRVHVHPIPDRGGLRIPIGAYLLGESRAADRFHERLVRETKPDVIHLHNISLLGLGVQSAPKGCPVLYTAHDYWFRCPRSDLLKFGRVPCESPACHSCMIRSRRLPALWRGTDIGHRMGRVDCVIAPSRFLQGMAKGSFRCPVIHIPNFVPDGNPDGMLAPESSYYLYAGVLEGHKGIGVLSQAMLDYGGSRRFVLVGRGSRERELQQLAERIGSRVELRSWVSQPVLSSLYSRASAFLMPSIWFENSPLAAIEALSWGVPLLTTSRGGVSELLHDGSAGYSFEPNPAGLLGALRVLEGLEDRKSLRRAARRAYEDHHRPATYLLRYLSIVRALGGGETPTDGVGGGGIPSSPVAGPTQGG